MRKQNSESNEERREKCCKTRLEVGSDCCYYHGRLQMSIFHNIFSHTDINAWIKNFRAEKRAVLLDVRTRDEYAVGHIEGSRNLPLDEIDRVGDVVENKEIPLYVHCRSGKRSAKAVAYLRGNGYKRVYDIGGIGAYRGEIVV